MEYQIAGTGNEIGLMDIIENNRLDIQEIFDRLPELDFFEGLELECQNDSFFESLLNQCLCASRTNLFHNNHLFSKSNL